MVRTSVFGWRAFIDLWFTGNNFVGKVPATGQPTSPTQPSIPMGSVMNSSPWIMGVETRAVYGCLIAGQSPWARA